MSVANCSGRSLLASIRSLVSRLQALIIFFPVALGFAFCSAALASTGGVIVGGVQSPILATGSVYWYGPVGVATDSTGNIYVAQCTGNQIVKIDAATHATTALPIGSYSVSCPQQLSMDSNNNLYIADDGNNRVIKYSTTSATVLAVYPVTNPFGVALDASGNIWVAGGGTVFKIPANAPSGTSATTMISTGLQTVKGITFDSGNNLWVSDFAANAVYEYAAPAYTSGTTILSNIGGPCQLFFDAFANLYLAERNNNAVYKFPYSEGYSTTTAIPLSTTVPEAETVAEDAQGNLFLTAWGNGIPANSLVTEISTAVASFGSQIGDTTSSSISFNFDVLAGTTIGSIKVLDQGVSGLEFKFTNAGSTCTAKPYSTATACSVQATFAPQYPGLRLGAVEVLDGSSNVLATAYVKGIGLAPLAGFSPGTVNVPTVTGLSPAISGPRRPASDPQGNLYVADMNNNRIVKIAPGGEATVVLSSSTLIADKALNEPNAVALDGAGNLYIADGNNSRVVELSAAGVASVLSNNGLTVAPPIGIAVDGSGNVYVADNGASRVVEYPYGGSAAVVSTSGVTLSGPAGIAVDGSNNIFVADAGSNRIVKITNGVGSVVSTGSLPLSNPRAITLDSPGNIYVSDVNNNRIVEISSGSGNAIALSTGSTVTLNGPIGAAVTGAGDLYIMDAGNNRIVVSSQETPPSLIFDTTAQGYQSVDSPQAITLLNLGNAPLAISVPVSGTNPSFDSGFTSDSSTTCPVVPYSGSAGSLAANGSCMLGVDFIPTGAGSNTGSVMLTDNTLGTAGSTQRIGVSGTGIVATVPSEPVGTPSPVQRSSFTFTKDFTLGSISVVTQGYTGLDFNAAIGGGCTAGAAYTTGQSCTANFTFTPTLPGMRLGAILLYDNGGNLVATQYISGVGYGPVLQFQPAAVSTAAGNGLQCSGNRCGDGGPAGSASISYANSVVLDAEGNTYIPDISNWVVRKISPTGVISTIGGTLNSMCPSPTSACGDGGPGTAAEFYMPSDLAIDGAGNLYISDKGDNRVRVLNLITGVLKAFAGTGAQCSSPTATCGDGGAATSALMGSIDGLAIDTAGNLYIGDTNDHKIRKVTASTGIISTIAGTGALCGTGSACGDGVPGTVAQINYPNKIRFDTNGNLYIADASANRVREISFTSGVISTVAGTGATCSNATSACGDGGAATSAQMGTVYGLALDGASNIYIVDSDDNKIRFVNSTTGIINTVMGTGIACSGSLAACGDGSTGASAQLNKPVCVAFDSQGNVEVCDANDRVVRKLTFAASILNFTNTSAGTTSSDSPKSVNIVNAGNAALIFPVPGTGTNPSIAGGYVLDTGTTTCPIVSSSGSADSLAVGSSCAYALNFSPNTNGQESGSLVLTDNNLGMATSSQTINLGVVGYSAATALTFATPPATLINVGGNAGSAITVDELNSSSAIVTSATDMIILMVTGPNGYSASYTSTAVAGVATFNLSSIALGTVGAYTYTASLTSAASATASETISPTTPTVAWPTASAITYGQTLASSTLTGGAGSVPGSFAFTAPGSTPGAGTASQSVTFTPTDTTDYNTVTGLVSVTVNTVTPTVSSSKWPTASSLTYGQTLGSSTLTGGAGSVPGSFAFTTPGTMPGAGTASQSVTFTPTDTTDYTTVTGTVQLVVSKATSADSVTAGTNPTLLQNAVTFTATVSSTAGTPTGTVNFLDGATPLGSGLLSGGVATLTTSALAAGSHNITAIYIGDTNFVAASSRTLTEGVVDFTLSAVTTSGGSGSLQTVLPGGSATFPLGISLTAGTGLPAPVTLTVSGMPEGATAIVTPSSWAKLTGTSWLFPANTPLSIIALSVQTPPAQASLDAKGLPSRKLPVLLWGVLLLPFAGKIRRTSRRLSRASLLLLLAVSMASMAGLSGCGSTTGFFAQQQKTYKVLVTAMSGTLSRSTTVTLTIE